MGITKRVSNSETRFMRKLFNGDLDVELSGEEIEWIVNNKVTNHPLSSEFTISCLSDNQVLIFDKINSEKTLLKKENNRDWIIKIYNPLSQKQTYYGN